MSDLRRSHRLAPAPDSGTPPSNQEAAMRRRESFEEFEATGDEAWDERNNPSPTRTTKRKQPRTAAAPPRKQKQVTDCMDFVVITREMDTKFVDSSSSESPRSTQDARDCQEQEAIRAVLKSIEGDSNGWTKLLTYDVGMVDDATAAEPVPWCTIGMIASLQRFYHKSNNTAPEQLREENDELRKKCNGWEKSREQWEKTLHTLTKQVGSKMSESDLAKYASTLAGLQDQVTSAKAETDEANRALDTIKEEQRQQDSELGELRQSLKKCKNDWSVATAMVGSRDEDLEELNQELAAAEAELSNSKKEGTRLREKLDEATSDSDYYQYRFHDCDEELKKAASANEKLERTLAQYRERLMAEREEHSTALKDLRGDLEPRVVQLRHKLETERKDHSRAMTKLQDDRKRLWDVTTDLQNGHAFLSEKIDRGKADNASLKHDLEQQIKTNNQFHAAILKRNKAQASLQRRHNVTNASLRNKEKERAETDQKYRDALDANKTLQSELQKQKELVALNQTELREVNRISEELLESNQDTIQELKAGLEVQEDLVKTKDEELEGAKHIFVEQLGCNQAKINTLDETVATLTVQLLTQKSLVKAKEEEIQKVSQISQEQLESKQAAFNDLDEVVAELSALLATQEKLVKAKGEEIQEADRISQEQLESKQAKIHTLDEVVTGLKAAQDQLHNKINEFGQLPNLQDLELAEGSLNPTVRCFHEDRQFVLRCFALAQGGVLFSLLADNGNSLWVQENPSATLLWQDDLTWLDLGVSRQGIRYIKLDPRTNSVETLRWLDERFPVQEFNPNEVRDM